MPLLAAQKQWELVFMGTPFDDVRLNDLVGNTLRDYKFYVFLNTFRVTPEQRAALQARFKRNHATALWVYAPGYIDKRLSVENISALTGIRLAENDPAGELSVQITSHDHRYTNSLPAGLAYGTDVNVENIRPSYNSHGYLNDGLRVSPRFWGDDEGAKVLGRLVGIDRPGLLVKEQPGWTSVYSSAPVVLAVWRRSCAISPEPQAVTFTARRMTWCTPTRAFSQSMRLRVAPVSFDYPAQRAWLTFLKTGLCPTEECSSLSIYRRMKPDCWSWNEFPEYLLQQEVRFMLETRAYAAVQARAPLGPFTIGRREPGPNDVMLDILYCGVCHSDIHQVRDEWGGGSIFPMVPGHEIVGKVAKIGDAVKKWKIGDTVGVGPLVDSCRECGPCKAGEEQFCERGPIYTYNHYDRDGKTPTYGGYSERITVSEDFVVRVPGNLSWESMAPLVCAGITTYSPLRHFGVKAGDRVAVMGLGGLGHMGVKIAAALGANVTVLSHSPLKRSDALRLGAHEFIATGDAQAMRKHGRQFDFILDTVSAPHDFNAYLELLRQDGIMVFVGLPDPHPLSPFSLTMLRRRLAGSFIGGIRETQEMLDFCVEHGIAADVEVIPIQKINEAFDRTVSSDVRYRFVIDMASLK
jgi:uncharacterized zinc-type alcohol dehydrogenase-like protein